VSLLDAPQRPPVIQEIETGLAQIDDCAQRELLRLALRAVQGCGTMPDTPRRLDDSVVGARAAIDEKDFEVASMINRSEERYVKLRGLAVRVSELGPIKALSCWRRVLESAESRGRQALLYDIRAMAPCLPTLAEEDVAVAISDAVLAVARWWP
jgi:hypothetical protein